MGIWVMQGPCTRSQGTGHSCTGAGRTITLSSKSASGDPRQRAKQFIVPACRYGALLSHICSEGGGERQEAALMPTLEFFFFLSSLCSGSTILLCRSALPSDLASREQEGTGLAASAYQQPSRSHSLSSYRVFSPSGNACG